MSEVSKSGFWDEVVANIGDRYRPHSAEYGVFLFREKLRRHGFREEEAPKLDPTLLARAVPWAGFRTFGAKHYLTLRHYGSHRNKNSGLPREAFSCFDERFQLWFGRVVPDGEGTVDEVALLTRISGERLAQLERGSIELYDAFRNAEDGHVFMIKSANAATKVVYAKDLSDSELPPKGERVPFWVGNEE